MLSSRLEPYLAISRESKLLTYAQQLQDGTVDSPVSIFRCRLMWFDRNTVAEQGVNAHARARRWVSKPHAATAHQMMVNLCH
jgi:hypothetical protein